MSIYTSSTMIGDALISVEAFYTTTGSGLITSGSALFTTISADGYVTAASVTLSNSISADGWVIPIGEPASASIGADGTISVVAPPPSTYAWLDPAGRTVVWLASTVPPGQLAVNVTSVDPQPDIGWTTPNNGVTWNAPVAVNPVANQAAILQKAPQSLSANAAFLALIAPTYDEILAQVQELTRQANGFIRLTGGGELLTSTEGT